MPLVVISPEADADLNRILEYIAIERSSPDGAKSLLRAFEKKCKLLAANPQLGELLSRERSNLRLAPFGTRHNPRGYILAFRPMENGIQVVRVFHGARDYDSLL